MKKNRQQNIPDIPEIAGIDIEAGLSIVQNNGQVYSRMLFKFADMYRDFKKIFNDAVKEQDPEAEIRLAHSLKGSAGNIGANELRRAASELEQTCRDKPAGAEIDRLIDSVTEAIAPVIEGIDDYRQSEYGMARSGQSAAGGRLGAETAARMRGLLEEDDAEAVTFLEEFISEAGSLQFEPSFKRFIKAVENYDFERALSELNRIEKND